jgi:hypothetical protein
LRARTSPIAHAQLRRLQKRVDHPEPGGIGEKLETLGQQNGVVAIEQTIGYRPVVA